MKYFGAFYFLSFLFFGNSLIYIWQVRYSLRLTFGLVLLGMGLLSFIESAFHSGHLSAFPWALGLSPLITSLSYSAFGIYMAFVAQYNQKRNLLLLLFFIPPVTELIIYLNFLWNNYGEMQLFYQNLRLKSNYFFYPSPISIYLEFVTGIFIYAGVVIFSLVIFKAGKTAEKFKKKIVATKVILSILALSIMAFHIYNHTILGFGNNYAIHDKFIIYLIIWIALIFFQVWPFYFKSGQVDFAVHTFGLNEYLNRYLTDKSTLAIQKALTNLTRAGFYKEEDIKLATLAAEAGVSTHQLSEYLNKHEKVNFFQYINKLRINDAQKLLCDPQKAVVEICYEVGYNSPATFYKAFKEITGMSPKAWQKSNGLKQSKQDA